MGQIKVEMMDTFNTLSSYLRISILKAFIIMHMSIYKSSLLNWLPRDFANERKVKR